MKNAFINVDGVLVTHGYVQSNSDGDTRIEVPDNFALEPGRHKWDGTKFVPYTPVKPVRPDKKFTGNSILDLIAKLKELGVLE